MRLIQTECSQQNTFYLELLVLLVVGLRRAENPTSYKQPNKSKAELKAMQYPFNVFLERIIFLLAWWNRLFLN